MTNQQQRTQWALDVFDSFVRSWLPPALQSVLKGVDDPGGLVRAAIRAIAPKGDIEPIGWAVFKREIDATYNHRDHPSGYVHTMISAVFDSIPTNAFESQRKKHPDQEFIICEIREIP